MSHCIEALKATFTEIQTCPQKTYTKKLKETVGLLNKTSESFNQFRPILKTLLLKAKDIPFKINNFIKKIMEEVEDKEFNKRMYEFLKSNIDCKNRTIRKNAFALLRNYDISEEVVIISEFLFDKDKNVRKEVVKLLQKFQEFNLNEKTQVLNLFKDLLRYDNSPDVRKEILRSIEVGEKTYKSIILKCEDPNNSIRKIFYDEILDLIDLKMIKKNERVLLLKKASSEREFDAKTIFSRKCRKNYAIKKTDGYTTDENILNFVEDFYDSNNLDDLKVLLKEYFPDTIISFDNMMLENIVESSSFLLYEYLNYVESEIGRETLELVPFNIFLEMLYNKSIKAVEDISLIPVVKNLFKIVNFYEIFEEGNQKIIKNLVYKLLARNFITEIVEQAVCLQNISSDSVFLGTLIKKNSDTDNVLLIAKSILKNVKPFGELHHAIINEIVLKKFKSNSFECLFYYNLIEPKEEHITFLIENVEMTFHYLADLYLSSIHQDLIREALFKFIRTNFNDSTIRMATKLMIFDATDLFLQKTMLYYYSTDNNELKQYLSVFFLEYFRRYDHFLISNFIDIICFLTTNHKIFVDQTLFWLQESQSLSSLIYKICCFLFKNPNTHQILLTNIFEMISLSNAEPLLNKKILYCCALLLKKHVNVNKLVSKIVTIDDGEPIDSVSLDEVKVDLGVKPDMALKN